MACYFVWKWNARWEWEEEMRAVLHRERRTMEIKKNNRVGTVNKKC